MTRYLLILVLIFISNYSFSQNIYFIKDSVMNSYMESGFANKEFAPQGEVDSALKRQGPWKDYEVVRDYSYCMVDGMPEQMWGNYLLYGEGDFKDSLRNGDWRFFLIDDMTFKKYLHKELSYNNGVPVGEFRYYFPSGNQGVKGTFVDGHMHGEVISYYNNGDIYGKREYKKGKKHGNHLYKYPNGMIELEHNFIDGLKDSLYISYYSDGKVNEKFYYNLDQIDGTYQYYYPNGQLWIEKVYDNGLLMEVNGSYAENGEERDYGSISKGKGTLKYYSEEGKVYSIHKYKHGLIVKEKNK